MICSLEDLELLCAEWQERLRLQDWRITLGIVRSQNFFAPGRKDGEVQYERRTKEAIIHILDPIDYPPDVIRPQDMEVTLVHELLHLLFATFTPENGTYEHDDLEFAIHALSTCLVNLKRSAKNGENRDS